MAGHHSDTEMTRIGDCVYLQKPGGTGGSVPSGDQPDLILIFGWMGAKLPHLLKYSKAYDEMYPGATKILVRAPPSVFFSPEGRKRANLAPAVEALEALGYVLTADKRKQRYGEPLEPLLPGKPSPRVLVHAFSNGGCWQLSVLSRILQERFKGVEAEPAASAVILDSCPSNGGIKETQKAFTTAIRNPILKRIAAIVITLLIYFGWIMTKLGSTPPLEVTKKILNQPKLLPWFTKATARLYIYSKTDELMPPGDVEGHAELAKRSGLQVRLEKYDASPHVAHARTDPVRYWNAVKQLWEDALKTAH